MSDPYLYPNSNVLVNKFGVTDAAVLDDLERFHVAQRMAEGAPQGDFDAEHLKSIHNHLFQDVYDWAGEFRTVHMTKGGSTFQFPTFIDTGVAHVHGKIQNQGYLQKLKRDEFTASATDILGDLNYAHPFREGNGRTQLLYMKQLSEQAGHPLDISRLRGESWIEASRASFHDNPEPMRSALHSAMIDQDREPDLEP